LDDDDDDVVVVFALPIALLTVGTVEEELVD
jgi:hypothetical protein